ncbi:hypothetical protein EDD21DRAFT_392979, partial [Dissophora ornata]
MMPIARILSPERAESDSTLLNHTTPTPDIKPSSSSPPPLASVQSALNRHKRPSTPPEERALIRTQSIPVSNNNDQEEANHSSPTPSQEEMGRHLDSFVTLPSSPTVALLLQFLTTTSTIVFTVLPVVITAGGDATWGHWYSWRDGCRLIEPFVSGQLHSWFFYHSDLMRRWPTSPSSSFHPGSKNGKSFKDSPRFKAVLSSVFTFFLILYVTGAGIHTAAAFFKSTISLFLEAHSQGVGLSTHPLTHGDGKLSLELAEELKQGYLLIQDVWEHSVSHYMYAFGALGMSWCEMIAYSSQVLPLDDNFDNVTKDSKDRGSKKWLVAFWVVVGLLYGAIVAGVACQYPKGLYVGSVYVILLLLVLCTYILTRPEKRPFAVGRYYIIQTYIVAGIFAAIIILIYIATHNFKMLTSNDQSHLDSINRP